MVRQWIRVDNGTHLFISPGKQLRVEMYKTISPLAPGCRGGSVAGRDG